MIKEIYGSEQIFEKILELFEFFPILHSQLWDEDDIRDSLNTDKEIVQNIYSRDFKTTMPSGFRSLRGAINATQTSLFLNREAFLETHTENAQTSIETRFHQDSNKRKAQSLLESSQQLINRNFIYRQLLSANQYLPADAPTQQSLSMEQRGQLIQDQIELIFKQGFRKVTEGQKKNLRQRKKDNRQQQGNETEYILQSGLKDIISKTGIAPDRDEKYLFFQSSKLFDFYIPDIMQMFSEQFMAKNYQFVVEDINTVFLQNQIQKLIDLDEEIFSGRLGQNQIQQKWEEGLDIIVTYILNSSRWNKGYSSITKMILGQTPIFHTQKAQRKVTINEQGTEMKTIDRIVEELTDQSLKNLYLTVREHEKLIRNMREIDNELLKPSDVFTDEEAQIQEISCFYDMINIYDLVTSQNVDTLLKGYRELNIAKSSINLKDVAIMNPGVFDTNYFKLMNLRKKRIVEQNSQVQFQADTMLQLFDIKNISMLKLMRVIQIIQDIVIHVIKHNKRLPLFLIYSFGNIPRIHIYKDNQNNYNIDAMLSLSKWNQTQTYNYIMMQVLERHEAHVKINLNQLRRGRDYNLFQRKTELRFKDLHELDNTDLYNEVNEQIRYVWPKDFYTRFQQEERIASGREQIQHLIDATQQQTDGEQWFGKEPEELFEMKVIIDNSFQNIQQSHFRLSNIEFNLDQNNIFGIIQNSIQLTEDIRRALYGDADNRTKNAQYARVLNEIQNRFEQVYQVRQDTSFYQMLKQIILEYNTGLIKYKRKEIRNIRDSMSYLSFQIAIPRFNIITNKLQGFSYRYITTRVSTYQLVIDERKYKHIQGIEEVEWDSINPVIQRIADDVLRDLIESYIKTVTDYVTIEGGILRNEEINIYNFVPSEDPEQDEYIHLFTDARIKDVKITTLFTKQDNDRQDEEKTVIELKKLKPQLDRTQIKDTQKKTIKPEEEHERKLYESLNKANQRHQQEIQERRKVKQVKRKQKKDKLISQVLKYKRIEQFFGGFGVSSIINTLISQKDFFDLSLEQQNSLRDKYKQLEQAQIQIEGKINKFSIKGEDRVEIKIQKSIQLLLEFLESKMNNRIQYNYGNIIAQLDSIKNTDIKKERQENQQKEEQKAQQQIVPEYETDEEEDEHGFQVQIKRVKKDRDAGVGRYQIQTVQENHIQLDDYKLFKQQFGNLPCLLSCLIFMIAKVKKVQFNEENLYNLKEELVFKYPQLYEAAQTGQVWETIEIFFNIFDEFNISLNIWTASNQSVYYQKYYVQDDNYTQFLLVISDYHVLMGDQKKLQSFINKKYGRQRRGVLRIKELGPGDIKKLKPQKIDPKHAYSRYYIPIDGQIDYSYKFPQGVKPYKQNNNQLVFDFETTSEKDKQMITFCCGLWGFVQDQNIEEMFSYDPDVPCEEQLVKYLMEISLSIKDKDIKIDLIGWNNSRFDNYFLLQALFKVIGPSNVQIAGSIQDSKLIIFDRYEVKDLCLTLQSTLKAACLQYGLKEEQSKKTFDILKFSTIDLMKQNKKEIEEYCLQDCRSVIYVLQAFQKQTEALKQEIIDKQIAVLDKQIAQKELIGEAVPVSISSFANKFLAYFFQSDNKNYLFRGIFDEQVYQKCRKSYYGGLTFLNRLTVEKETYFLDVSSLYPSVMNEPDLPCEYQCTIDRNLDCQPQSFVSHNLYLVTSFQYKNNKIPKIPLKINFVNIYVRQSSSCSVYMWGCELDRDDFEQIHIEEELQFKASGSRGQFQNLIQFIYDQKQLATQQNKPVLRTICKLILNSLYGYFGKKIYPETQYFAIPEWDAYVGGQQADQVINKTKKSFAKNLIENGFQLSSKYIDDMTIVDIGLYKYLKVLKQVPYDSQQPGSCVYVASYITAKARRIMYDLINIADISNLIYMDTDSLVVRRAGYDALKNKDKIRNQLGYLMNEISGQPDDAICPNFQGFAKKVYISQKEDGSVVKAAFKGVTKDEVKQLPNGLQIKKYSSKYFDELRKHSNDPSSFQIGFKDQLTKSKGTMKRVIQSLHLQLKCSMKVNQDGSTEYYKNKEEYLQFYNKQLVYQYDKNSNTAYNFIYL